VEIEDYEELKCVKRFSDFFDLNATIEEVLFQIAKKKSVCLDIANGRDFRFQLLFVDSLGGAHALEREEKIGQLGLSPKDTLLLRQIAE